MANIPHAHQYRTRANPTTEQPSHPQATPATPERPQTGDGSLMGTLAGAGILYLVGGPWTALIGGLTLAALLFSSDD